MPTKKYDRGEKVLFCSLLGAPCSLQTFEERKQKQMRVGGMGKN
jgi:hypothetical protein